MKLFLAILLITTTLTSFAADRIYGYITHNGDVVIVDGKVPGPSDKRTLDKEPGPADKREIYEDDVKHVIYSEEELELLLN